MFTVGDRVIAVRPVDGLSRLIGKCGTVIEVSGASKIGVEFDERFPEGHTCNRGKSGYCRWGNVYEFEHCENSDELSIDEEDTKRLDAFLNQFL